MAWLFQLTDGVNTADLNDGTSYGVSDFRAPVPQLRGHYAGAGSPFRPGRTLIGEPLHENRIVVVDLNIVGTSRDNLLANIAAIEAQVRRAHEYATGLASSRMQLKVQWDSATNAGFFNVVSASLDAIGEGSHRGNVLVGSSTLLRRRLILECSPYITLASDIVIQNYIRDPSFEVAGTALADWTESKTATGTTGQDATQSKYGSKSLKLEMTAAGSSGQVIERNQVLTDVDAAEVWSWGVWVNVTALGAECKFVFEIDPDGDGASASAERTTTTSGWMQLPLPGETVPAGATQVTVRVYLESTGTSTPTGVVYVDGLLGDEQATLPDVWVSCREVSNHFDDNAQLHTSYLDIENVPGDVSALMQIRIAEDEVHTDVWVGARVASRRADAGIWHEGEDFLDGSGTSIPDTVDANSSNGNYADVQAWAQFVEATTEDSASATNHTYSHSVTDSDNRLLLVSVYSFSVAQTHDSVTYNAVAMTKVDDVVSGAFRFSVWRLVSPATGANDVVITLSGASTVRSIATTVKGAHQTTPLGTAANATALAPSIGLTTVAGDLCYGALGGPFQGGAGVNPSIGAGETERAQDPAGGGVDRVQTEDERATGTSTTVSWTMTGASAGSLAIAVPIKPASLSAASPAVITKAITTPPRGRYRVLARVNEQGTAADVRIGVGYAYGGNTSDPSVAADYQSVAGSTFEKLDIGELVIPPSHLPENATIGTYTIRIAIYSAEASNYDDGLQIDSVWLEAVDRGTIYVTKSSAADVILIDGFSEDAPVARLNTSNVLQGIPGGGSGGTPPEAHPDGTRLYFGFDDTGGDDIADGAKVKIVIRPQFLSLPGA